MKHFFPKELNEVYCCISFDSEGTTIARTSCLNSTAGWLVWDRWFRLQVSGAEASLLLTAYSDSDERVDHNDYIGQAKLRLHPGNNGSTTVYLTAPPSSIHQARGESVGVLYLLLNVPDVFKTANAVPTLLLQETATTSVAALPSHRGNSATGGGSSIHNHHNFHTPQLMKEVDIICARHLQGRNKCHRARPRGSSSRSSSASSTLAAYVRVLHGTSGKVVATTRTIYGTRNPGWHEHFVIPTDAHEHHFIAQVFDHDPTSPTGDRFIGEALLPLQSQWHGQHELHLLPSSCINKTTGTNSGDLGTIVVGLGVPPCSPLHHDYTTTNGNHHHHHHHQVIDRSTPRSVPESTDSYDMSLSSRSGSCNSTGHQAQQLITVLPDRIHPRSVQRPVRKQSSPHNFYFSPHNVVPQMESARSMTSPRLHHQQGLIPDNAVEVLMLSAVDITGWTACQHDRIHSPRASSNSTSSQPTPVPSLHFGFVTVQFDDNPPLVKTKTTRGEDELLLKSKCQLVIPCTAKQLIFVLHELLDDKTPKAMAVCKLSLCDGLQGEHTLRLMRVKGDRDANDTAPLRSMAPPLDTLTSVSQHLSCGFLIVNMACVRTRPVADTPRSIHDKRAHGPHNNHTQPEGGKEHQPPSLPFDTVHCQVRTLKNMSQKLYPNDTNKCHVAIGFHDELEFVHTSSKAGFNPVWYEHFLLTIPNRCTRLRFKLMVAEKVLGGGSISLLTSHINGEHWIPLKHSADTKFKLLCPVKLNVSINVTKEMDLVENGEHSNKQRNTTSPSSQSCTEWGGELSVAGSPTTIPPTPSTTHGMREVDITHRLAQKWRRKQLKENHTVIIAHPVSPDVAESARQKEISSQYPYGYEMAPSSSSLPHTPPACLDIATPEYELEHHRHLIREVSARLNTPPTRHTKRSSSQGSNHNT